MVHMLTGCCYGNMLVITFFQNIVGFKNALPYSGPDTLIKGLGLEKSIIVGSSRHCKHVFLRL